MPRVTRRSLAASTKEEEKPEPQPTRSRGRRGAKAAEPEDAGSVDEPQETPSKQGRRGGRARETTPVKEVAPKGRTSSRSAARGRGKTEAEPAEEDAEEEKEEKVTPGRGTRGRGKRGGGKGRSSGRSSRGKAPEEEEEEEEEEEAAESIETVAEPKTSSGTRGRGKSKPVAEEEEPSKTEEKEEKTTPRGRSRKTPTKAESEPTPPSGGGRRSGRRGQTSAEAIAEEVTTQKTPSRSSKRGAIPPPEAKIEQEEKVEEEKVEEVMETEQPQAEAEKSQEMAAPEEESKDEIVGQKRKHSEDSEAEDDQKRARLSDTAPAVTSRLSDKAPAVTSRLSDKAPAVTSRLSDKAPAVTSRLSDKAPAVPSRLSDTSSAVTLSDTAPVVTMSDTASAVTLSYTAPTVTSRMSDKAPAETSKDDTQEELSDFVIVSKEEVPAADSKEVTDALPPVKKADEAIEEDKVPEEKEESAISAEPEKMDEGSPEVVKEPVTPEATKESEVMETEETEQTGPKKAETVVLEPEASAASVEMTDDGPSQTDAKDAVAAEIPAVVPLTEAELAKQYNPTIRDRDETSSTLVEVGSEAASDVMSTTRNLDVSDAVSMDATVSEVSEQAGEESYVSSVSDVPSEKQAEPDAPASIPENSTVNTSSNIALEVSLPSQSSDVSTVPAAPTPVVNSNTPQLPSAGVPLNSIPLPPSSVVSTTSPSPPSAPSSTSSVAAPNHSATANVTQNGNFQSSNPSTQSVPLHTSTPAKRPNFASLEGYSPSSTSFDKRKFIINSSFPIELFDTAFCFSVVSYNILADCHMRRNDYSYTEPQYLDQSYRHNLLTQEIEYLDGDIVCMQEVNPSYYNNVLKPYMISKGYQGLFMKRTQDLCDEGEATFVKSSKFEIVSHQGLSLKDLAYKEIDSGGLSEEVTRAAKKYLDRPDVIVLCKLLSKKTGKTLTVCNIHVVWDFMRSPDVQCIQAACAIKELVSMAGSDHNPYIICGDFNSEITSPAYHLVKEGYLSDAHIRNLQALEKMDNTDGSSRSLINHLWRAFQHTSSNLKSAYETAIGKEPGLTSFTKNTHAALDYIFFSSSSLYTVGALEVIDQQVLEATGGLPSKNIPSDHVSLKALFRLKD